MIEGSTVVLVSLIVIGLAIVAAYVPWGWLGRWARWRASRPRPDFGPESTFLSELYWWRLRRPDRR